MLLERALLPPCVHGGILEVKASCLWRPIGFFNLKFSLKLFCCLIQELHIPKTTKICLHERSWRELLHSLVAVCVRLIRQHNSNISWHTGGLRCAVKTVNCNLPPQVFTQSWFTSSSGTGWQPVSAWRLYYFLLPDFVAYGCESKITTSRSHPRHLLATHPGEHAALRLSLSSSLTFLWFCFETFFFYDFLPF